MIPHPHGEITKAGTNSVYDLDTLLKLIHFPPLFAGLIEFREVQFF